MSGTRSTAIPMDWADQGACRGVDPKFFYPERGEPAEPAKEVCDRCDVRSHCLQYALDNDEKTGVWGGTSEKQRRLMRRDKRLAEEVR